MAGCNIIQDIPQASVSKKLECKIFAASCTICHAVSVIIQKLVGKGSHTPDGGITANKHPKARKKSRAEVRNWERKRESSGSTMAKYKLEIHWRGTNVWNAVSNVLMETNTHP
jgi:hypothetical protein